MDSAAHSIVQNILLALTSNPPSSQAKRLDRQIADAEAELLPTFTAQQREAYKKITNMRDSAAWLMELSAILDGMHEKAVGCPLEDNPENTAEEAYRIYSELFDTEYFSLPQNSHIRRAEQLLHEATFSLSADSGEELYEAIGLMALDYQRGAFLAGFAAGYAND